jgi:hypothetical protein
MAISLDGTTGISASGNITGNNVITTSAFAPASISTAGNVTGSYILGNGSLLTGVSTTSSNINNGTSNVTVVSSGGNVTTGVGGTGNVIVAATTGAFITGVLSATGNITGGNISATNYTGTSVSVTGTTTAASVVGGVITGSSTSVTGTTTAASVVGGVITGTSTSVSGTTTAASVVGGVITGTSVSVSGNVTGNYILGNGSQLTGLSGTSITNGTSNIVIASSANVTIAVTGTNIIQITAAGIENRLANGVGNIGNSTGYFNTVFAKATSAQYADLAEMYVSDQTYPPGTVVEFGGNQEITVSSTSHSTAVAGIVSTNPSYLMNATQTGNNVVAVALIGRVPCQVVGTISKGDRLVSSDITGVAAPLNMTNYQPGCIIGKAMDNYNSNEVGVIEVAVGRD